MKSLFDRHIELVESVNNSSTEKEHLLNEARLIGFRDALEILGEKQMIDCDNYYLYKGINRPMCCGIWLDWEPK